MDEALLRRTLLYVEDDFATRQNYLQFFRRFFREVHEASNGNEGFRLYRDMRPDIIIADIEMPGMDGLELVRKIRRLDHAVRVILLTAHSDVPRLLAATELKLTKYLTKPVTRDELKNALNAAQSELMAFTVVPTRQIALPGGHLWHCEQLKLTREGEEIVLTNKENRLLARMLHKPGYTVKTEELVSELWDTEETDKGAALKTIIKNLRRKLPEGVLLNVYGVGYRMQC